MRSDMAKVIRERARRGSSSKNEQIIKKRHTKVEDDEVGSKETMYRRSWNNDYQKTTSIYFSPLVKFLRKAANEGRLWDDVYSELSENAKTNSSEYSNVKEIVSWFVKTAVVMIDGEPYEANGQHKIVTYRARSSDFYVHPDSGILCEAPRLLLRKNRVKNDNKPFKMLDGEGYHIKDGIWYHLTWVGTEHKQRWTIVDHNGVKVSEVTGDKPNLPEFKFVTTGYGSRAKSFKATSELMVLPLSYEVPPYVGSWKVSKKFLDKGLSGQTIKSMQVDSRLQKKLSED